MSLLKKILCISDSFKGTLTSETVNQIVAHEGKKHFPQAQFQIISVADGGEGSVSCFLQALGGEVISARVKGPLFQDMDADYALLSDGRTAVIEMAACAGLPLTNGCNNPERTTTYGVGQLIVDAVERGAQTIILGLGGSCTNDGGCGLAAALGVEFFDDTGTSFVPTGGTLKQIARIITEKSIIENHKVDVIAMCDVNNPACGEKGAARVYAPQKGADAAMVERLDCGVTHLCALIERDLGKSVRDVPGAGAAGAMGAGVQAFLNGRLMSGIETVLDQVHFDRLLEQADMVITGEGKLDSQSVQGKVIDGVARRAKRCGVPVIALVGGAGSGAENAYQVGVDAIVTCNRMPEALSSDQQKNRDNLAFAADNLFRMLKLAHAFSG